MPRARFAPGWVSFSLVLGGLTLACGLSPAPGGSTPEVSQDVFAVVRATSETAYASGQRHLERGEAIQALIDLDRAKTNDPDSRPEVQQALDEAIRRVRSLTPTVEPVPAPAARATRPVPDGSPSQLLAWRDPQGRFSISAPADWQTVDQPAALFGAGVVEFRDPSGRMRLDVAVDGASKAASSELYAAGMDLTMQQQVPGYTVEQALLDSTAGEPSVRRVFTFTQQDAVGHEQQARSVQVALLKGSTPYIISGYAPAEQFEQYRPTFDQMLGTFRFGSM